MRLTPVRVLTLTAAVLACTILAPRVVQGRCSPFESLDLELQSVTINGDDVPPQLHDVGETAVLISGYTDAVLEVSGWATGVWLDGAVTPDADTSDGGDAAAEASPSPQRTTDTEDFHASK